MHVYNVRIRPEELLYDAERDLLAITKLLVLSFVWPPFMSLYVRNGCAHGSL